MPTSVAILAWGGAIALVALTVLIDAVSRARRLRRQRELSDLAALSWQQFEEVIADAFRRHGYRVREVGGRGRPDGGVDLILTRGGQTTVVQAKHWRSDRVGVQLVRELYGVQRAMQADHAMFVVSIGRYTADAVQFAAQVGMTLVEGEELLRIISTGVDGQALELPQPEVTAAPTCSACGAAMVRRTARQGPYAGQDFWGCSTFPACHGTASIRDEVPITL
jgi:restriction system protein